MHDKPEKVFEDAEKLRQIDLDVPFIEQIREVFRKQHIKLKAHDMEGMVNELWRFASNH